MYVAVSGAGKYRIIQFVEQQRIPGSTKKKTTIVRTIGNYEKLVAENPNILEELRAEAKRLTQEKKSQQAPVTIEVAQQNILAPQDALASLRFGHSLGLRLWDQLGLSSCLKKHCRKRNLPGLTKAIQGLLFHRIAAPRSVLGTFEDLTNYAGFGDIGLDLHYRSLELLATYKEEIIDHLCRFFEKNTARQGPLAYYDVTTLLFRECTRGRTSDVWVLQRQ